MTQRSAIRALSIILILSFLLLGFSFVLKKWKPELFPGLSEDPIERRKAQLSRLDEFPLELQTADAAARNERGLLQWAEKSVAADYHKADLAIYRKRPKNSKALEGILIFIDAGEDVKTVVPTPSQANATEGRGYKAAETDPLTGLPISRQGQQRMETRVEESPDLAKSEILSHLAGLLRDKLKALGAEVILTRDLSGNGSDMAQAAVVAETLGKRFLRELEEQKFACSPLSALLPGLEATRSENQNTGYSELFTATGVGPELRLLLDIERQYRDVLLLSLRLGKSQDQESGARVVYFSSGLASSIGSASLSEAARQEQPAYVSYPSSSRRKLAEQIERNIRGLLPDMAYQGRQQAVGEELLILDRLSNLSSARIIVGYETQESNLKVLVKREMQKSLADAISHACFQFFCEQP